MDTFPSLLSDTKRAKAPTESGRQSTCNHVPRCGVPITFNAHELAMEKSPDRGLSTSVETLKACVSGEKSKLPAKYSAVTNCPKGPHNNTCVNAFQVFLITSSEVITGKIWTSQTFSRAILVLFLPFSQRAPRIRTRHGYPRLTR